MDAALGGDREPHDDDPVVIDDPTLGFHPDQLNSYPLQRVGPYLYVADVEGVMRKTYGPDTLLIDSNRMEDYTFGGTSAENFIEVPITYRSQKDEKGYEGSGDLVIEDFQEIEEPNFDPVKDQELSSLLLTTPDEGSSLEEIGRILKGDHLSVQIQNPQRKALPT